MLSKTTLLAKTNYGLDIYSHILAQYYPGNTVPHQSGNTCELTRNPFNNDKFSLRIQIVDDCARHLDTEGAIAAGDAIDFARLHFRIDGDQLLQHVDRLLQPGGNTLKGSNSIVSTQPSSNKRFEPQFSFFEPPIENVLPARTMTPKEVYLLIRSTALKQRTESLRAISNEKEAKLFKKKNFPYLTFSGVFSSRKDIGLIEHSGCMVLDFDGINDPESIRDRLIFDAYFETVLLFTSPSGKGFKWVIEIDPDGFTHAQAFVAISKYIWDTYGLKIDPSGKDVSRACFLPYDPSAFINRKYL
jgi:hypothetical protein